MAKTLTITDDELGATASVRIEEEDGHPVVRSLHFEAAAGFGLSSQALQLMEQLGLRLPPTAPQVQAPVQRRKQPKKPPPVKKAAPAAKKQPTTTTVAAATAAAATAVPAAPAAGGEGAPAALPAPPAVQFVPAAEPAKPAPPVQRRPYRSGPPPAVDELREVFREHRGSVTAMAEHYGCAVSTVSTWLRRAREQGAKITLGGLEPVDAS